MASTDRPGGPTDDKDGPAGAGPGTRPGTGPGTASSDNAPSDTAAPDAAAGTARERARRRAATREAARDREGNRFTGRVARYAKVSGGMGNFALRYAGGRLMGQSGASEADRNRMAGELRAALGNLKGPLMKVAQILATVPDLVPPEYAEELAQLQSSAPPMGWPFVKRRMRAELGPEWQSRFASFEREAAAAASLGQVHKAVHQDGRPLACKLQYPDMSSAVEADLNQLQILLNVYRRMDRAIDPREIAAEIGERLREELDYDREAAHIRLYREMLEPFPEVTVPEVIDDLSTPRLLTMTWLTGDRLLNYKTADQETRNQISTALYRAWWMPFSRYGTIHGDPHLGNYTVREGEGGYGINLLDFGCVRIFPAEFVGGVVDLYRAIRDDDMELAAHAYKRWGFKTITKDLMEALNIWAKFIYGPLLDDRVRTVADGISPGEYGRREAFEVHQRLKALGPVTPPREFVFMDRAAIGLGAVFLHLQAELNFHRLFEETIADYDTETVHRRQADALARAGVPRAEIVGH